MSGIVLTERILHSELAMLLQDRGCGPAPTVFQHMSFRIDDAPGGMECVAGWNGRDVHHRITSDDMLLPVESFSERFLRPMAAMLTPEFETGRLDALRPLRKSAMTPNRMWRAQKRQARRARRISVSADEWVRLRRKAENEAVGQMQAANPYLSLLGNGNLQRQNGQWLSA